MLLGIVIGFFIPFALVGLWILAEILLDTFTPTWRGSWSAPQAPRTIVFPTDNYRFTVVEELMHHDGLRSATFHDDHGQCYYGYCVDMGYDEEPERWHFVPMGEYQLDVMVNGDVNIRDTVLESFYVVESIFPPGSPMGSSVRVLTSSLVEEDLPHPDARYGSRSTDNSQEA